MTVSASRGPHGQAGALGEREGGEGPVTPSTNRDASRIEAGTLDLRLERTDVRTLVEHVVDLYLAGQPPRDIALSAPDEPVFSRCDPTRLEQALGNLVSNALKYSPEASRVEVSVSESRAAKEVVIAVSDQGIGLSAEEARQVFEPFARIGSLRARTGRGPRARDGQ